MHPSLSEPTLAAAFLATARTQPHRVALRTFGTPAALTYGQWLTAAREVAGALQAFGVQHGDRVALLLGTTAQFHVADMGALLLGAVPFSLYATAPPTQLVPCLANAGARVLFTDAVRLPAARALVELCPELELLVVLDEVALQPGELALDSLRALCPAEYDVDESAGKVCADDLCALVYTSGTTGPPKGVPYLHRSLMQTMASIHHHVPVSPGGRVISYLPMAHIAERMFGHYAGFVFGYEITSLPDPTRLAEALRSVRPTRFFGVPRTYERLLADLRNAVTAEADSPEIQAAWARASDRVAAEQASGTSTPVPPGDQALLARLPAMVGLQHAECVAVAGAPSRPAALIALHAAGIPVTEMYGMSETIIATANPPHRVKIGTCGTALPGVQLRIAPDGEILIGGITVMQGYFGDPHRTEEVLRDGWMHSGDIGRLDAEGYLTVVDRKKALIINDGGKNMSPAAIEQAIKGAHPLLAHVVPVGDAKPHITALIVLDRDGLEALRTSAGLGPLEFAELTRHPVVADAVDRAVATGNQGLARVEQVRRYVVLDHDWIPGDAELTPTGKVRRDRVLHRYRDQIEELYR